MEKMDLSKKVLASLLTMSCVYLGGHPRSRWQRRQKMTPIIRSDKLLLSVAA